MKFFSKIQIFGVALATCVALSLTACGESKGGGENKEQSKEENKEENKKQNKEESKEQGKEENKEENKKENSQLSAYVKRQCPQCVFAAKEMYEASVGLDDWDGSCLIYMRIKERREELKAFRVRFDERFKIKTTVQKYKVRDDYQPEDKWEWRVFSEYAITLLSMPEGVKKVAMSVNGSRLEDFTAPQQTQKVYRYGDSDTLVWFRTNALDGKPFCLVHYSVKQNNANEQVKPSFDCAKASTIAEKLVCSDNELANLYNELSKAYTNILNLLDDKVRKIFVAEYQEVWLEPFNQCADKECVKQSLQKLINYFQEEIENLTGKAPNPANETPSAQSADETKASTNEQSPANEQVKPSFDCAKASTNAEKLVCSDNELANLDNELSKAYTNARNSLDNAGKKQLTSEQKAWLETYNQCADKECVKQSLQKRIELLQNTDMRIYLATKDEFVNLRKSPNGEIITPIYKKDFDKIILKRLGVEDKWLKVLYFPPNVSDEKEALTGYIHNSQIK